jgi:hypothetical protein
MGEIEWTIKNHPSPATPISQQSVARSSLLQKQTATHGRRGWAATAPSSIFIYV